MKKSGLDELESLNLDWNAELHMMTHTIIWGEGCLVTDYPALQSSSKKVQDDIDLNSPFTIKYNYGYLR